MENEILEQLLFLLLDRGSEYQKNVFCTIFNVIISKLDIDESIYESIYDIVILLQTVEELMEEEITKHSSFVGIKDGSKIFQCVYNDLIFTYEYYRYKVQFDTISKT